MAEDKPPAKKENPFGFSFSLLPAPSELEVSIEEERSDSLLYSILLVFFAVSVFLIILIAELLFVAPSLQQSNAAVQLRKSQITAFDAVKAINGELFVKVNTLKPILEKNIDPSDIFAVSDAIDSSNNLQVISFNRETSGVFVFQVISRSFADVEQLINILEGLDTVRDPSVRESVFNSSGRVVVTVVAFNIVPK